MEELMNKLNQEGFWYSKTEQHYPMPVHTDIEHPLKHRIIKAYKALLDEDRFNPHRDDSFRTNKNVIFYRGSSYCRICASDKQYDKVNNKILLSMGSRQYVLNGWEWPEGYLHYIEVHNVMPSKEWLKDVLDIEKE